MDSLDYAQQIAARFNLDLGDTDRMLLDAIRHVREGTVGARRPTYRAALKKAAGLLADWLEHGAECHVTLDWADLARFARSHTPSHVWAICIAKARAASAVRCDKCDGENTDPESSNYCPKCRADYQERIASDPETRPVGTR